MIQKQKVKCNKMIVCHEAVNILYVQLQDEVVCVSLDANSLGEKHEFVCSFSQ